MIAAVWFTRELTEAEISAVKESGIKPVIHPLVEINPFPAEKILKATKSLPKPDAIAFTSKNGVEAFLRIKSLLKDFADGTPMYCLGNATAEKLLEIGLDCTVANEPTGAGLATLIANEISPGAIVWHFCSTIKRPETGDTLRDAGLSYIPIESYETRGLPEAGLPGEAFDAVVFYSPSVVRAFAKMNPSIPENVPLCAIGPTTAGELKNCGYSGILVSEHPSTESLIGILQESLPKPN